MFFLKQTLHTEQKSCVMSAEVPYQYMRGSGVAKENHGKKKKKKKKKNEKKNYYSGYVVELILCGYVAEL